MIEANNLMPINRNKNEYENDVLSVMTQANSEKEIPSAPIRSRT